ncbi:MAG TPA: hypothetical protein VF715_17675 [Thermoleophilaceae bacterium]|jgi:hypothetical protein
MKKLVLVTAVVAACFTYAPAAGAVTFDGLCDLPGQTTYSKDLVLLPQEITWKFRIDPTTAKCTGFVDGRFVVDTPAGGHVTGTGPISCGTSLTATFNAKGQLEFPGLGLADPNLGVTVHLVAPAAQNLLVIQGKDGGYATGRASFLGQNDVAGTTQDCIDGEGANNLRFTVQMKTVGPMSG